MTLCPSASQLLLFHPCTRLPVSSQRRSTSSSFHPPTTSLSIRLSFRLSPDAGFHYTSIGLWLLPSLRAALSSLPPAAQFPWLCISTPPSLLFLPSVSTSFFLTISCFFALSFLSSAPSVLTIYSICHANPPSFSFRSFSIATLPFLPSVLFLPLPLHFWELLKRHLYLTVSFWYTHLYLFSSLSSFPFPCLHFPECYWWRSWLQAKARLKRGFAYFCLLFFLPVCLPVTEPAVSSRVYACSLLPWKTHSVLAWSLLWHLKKCAGPVLFLVIASPRKEEWTTEGSRRKKRER